MMWTITIFIHSYVPKTPTFRHLTLTEPLLPKPQAAQRAPAPLLTDAARTAGDGLASLPDPNSVSLKGPLALPPGDAPPPAASPTGPTDGEAAAVTNSAQSAATTETASSEAVIPEAMRGGLDPTGPAETAPNAPAVASAVTNSAQSAATTETASSEAVTPVQRDRLTATEPATGSIAPVGPVPLPRVRPVDAVPSSPPSGSPLFAPAPWGYPALEGAR
jgi:hypothetical protein